MQRVQTEIFGELEDGRVVHRFRLTNVSGNTIEISNLGGAIVSVQMPDRTGMRADLVLGFDTPQEYLTHPLYFGAIVGRYANRIADGRFSLQGKTYRLTQNLGVHHLHGGGVGFDKRLWDANVFECGDAAVVRLALASPDGEEGYPGKVDVVAYYRFDDQDRLSFDVVGVSDAPTPFGPSQHSYFNLTGHGAGTVLDHDLQLNSTFFTPTDERMIPTGEIRSVVGTPLDFRESRPVGSRIEDLALWATGGYDHNFVLNRSLLPGEPAHAATLSDSVSGRRLDIFTDMPGLQVFSANFSGDPIPGKNGAAYARHQGLALEPQYFPDTPNRPHFPNAILMPEIVRRTRTVYQFSTSG